MIAPSTAVSMAISIPTWSVLGNVSLPLLIAALIVREVAAFAGDPRLLPLRRSLWIAIVPLSLVTMVVLVQQVISLS